MLIIENLPMRVCKCCDGFGKELDHRAVGRLLRKERLARGKSQALVARRLKVSAPYICDLENGTRNWTIKRVSNYLKNLS